MVTGYTATEFGDYMIASLKKPYERVLRVTGWEILAGVQNQKTPGTISTNRGSNVVLGNMTNFSLLRAGDSIIIGNTTVRIRAIVSPIELELDDVVPFSVSGAEYYLPIDRKNTFEYEYRWSDTGQQYSEFRPLTKSGRPTDLLGLRFDSEKPLYLDVKAEVSALQRGATISILSITYTIETADGKIESCPQFCVECTDPFMYNGCANIEVSCDANLFKPYELGKSVSIYKQLVGMASDIFGHTVQYFRTEPDARTADVTLMEYSLFNVVDKQDIKILVPGNEFPEEAPTYDIFGMEFAEFEVHITAQEFEKVFGPGVTPRNLDYMYIPIINRMYEVSSMSIADEFNQASSYWRVKLVKYQERSSVSKNQFEADTDSLTVGVEEIFGEAQREEQEKVSNPQQFQTVTTAYRDGIRGFVDQNLEIRDYDLKNRWTVVSKNYYDMTQIKTGETGVEYAVQSKLDTKDNLALTLWFSPKFSTDSSDNYFIFGDLNALSGLKTYISNQEFTVVADGNSTAFTHGVDLNEDIWYGLVLNINNKFLQMSLSIYELDESNNFGAGSNVPLPQGDSNNLIQQYSEVIELGQPLTWAVDSNYHIRGNEMWMTNLRLFTNVIEEEQHHNVLNQYVVRDNQLSIIIDNAIPSLGYQRFKNAR